MDQPFDKRNDNPEAPDLEAPKSDDNNFGITAKDNKAAEKKPAEKKAAEKKSEEKKIAEKKSSTSSIRKQARLFLACLCFAGAVFAVLGHLHLFALIVCLHQLLPCLYARKTEHNTDHG